jgi:hypothetical protein
MKTNQLKTLLSSLDHLIFKLENGDSIPNHFHITEWGLITKHFVDCGGVIREEKKVTFQIWTAEDYDHQMHPSKLLKIIDKYEKQLNISDTDIEVEYQNTTIGKYSLDFDGESFVLKNTSTTCLAMDQCGIPTVKQKIKLSDLSTRNNSCCTSEAGFC